MSIETGIFIAIVVLWFARSIFLAKKEKEKQRQRAVERFKRMLEEEGQDIDIKQEEWTGSLEREHEYIGTVDACQLPAIKSTQRITQVSSNENKIAKPRIVVGDERGEELNDICKRKAEEGFSIQEAIVYDAILHSKVEEFEKEYL